MIRMLPLPLVFFILLLTTGHSNAQTQSVGIIKSLSGEVFLVNEDLKTKAAANMKINRGDTIVTGANSSVGLIFTDDTVVSLGPGSEINVENYLFNPADQELSFVTKLLRGTFSFITGQIAKLAPQNVKLETPNATLGVRGTKFVVKVD